MIRNDNRIEKKICANPECKKEFLKKKIKGRNNATLYLRPFNALTCSSKCSRKYQQFTTREYNKKRNR